MRIRAWVPVTLGAVVAAGFLGQSSRPAAPAMRPASAPASQAASAPATEAAVNPAIPADLAKTIQNGLKLAEEGNYRDLIETLAPPDAVAQMKTSGQFDQAVESFGQRAPMLIDALHQVLSLPPDMSEDGKTATFHVTGPRPEMTFLKVEDKWVLR